MVPSYRFKPLVGTSQTITDTAAHLLGGNNATLRTFRIAWSGGPGFIAFGGSGIVGTDAANKISLPTAAGVEMIQVGADQDYFAVTTGITLNVMQSS